MSLPHKKAGVDRRIDSDSGAPVVTCDWPGEIAVTNEEVDLLRAFLDKEIQMLLGDQD